MASFHTLFASLALLIHDLNLTFTIRHQISPEQKHFKHLSPPCFDRQQQKAGFFFLWKLSFGTTSCQHWVWTHVALEFNWIHYIRVGQAQGTESDRIFWSDSEAEGWAELKWEMQSFNCSITFFLFDMPLFSTGIFSYSKLIEKRGKLWDSFCLCSRVLFVFVCSLFYFGLLSSFRLSTSCPCAFSHLCD